MTHTTPIRRGAVAAVLAAAAALAACTPDPWTAQAAEAPDPLPVRRVEAAPATPVALPAPAEPPRAELIVDKVRDAGIGAAVGAELARDAALATAPVVVDSVGGHVALRGTAPDVEARERATEIAGSVEGVIAVENVLEVATAEGASR